MRLKSNVLNKASERIGETVTTPDGHLLKIIDYRSYTDIDILLDNKTLLKGKTYDMFKRASTSYIRELSPKIGETKQANNGQIMRIIAYRSATDLDVQFEDETVVTNRSYEAFKRGQIRNPHFGTSSIRDKRIGETITTSDGHTMKIIGYRNSNDIDIQVDSSKIIERTTYSFFKKHINTNPKVYTSKLGETSKAKNGQTMKIIDYRSPIDIDIQFDDGTVRKGITYQCFKMGAVKNPNLVKTKNGKTTGRAKDRDTGEIKKNP